MPYRLISGILSELLALKSALGSWLIAKKGRPALGPGARKSALGQSWALVSEPGKNDRQSKNGEAEQLLSNRRIQKTPVK